MLNILPAPVSAQDLARYIAYLSNKLSFSSIKNYLSIVRLIHLEAGYPNPLESYYIATVLKGARRTLGDSLTQKFPITISILSGIHKQITFSSIEDIVFWAACLVAFFSFFRKSNLFAPSIQEFNPKQHLARDNVSFDAKGALLSVKWSKTIQYQERVLDVPLPFIPKSPFCPSTALWLAMQVTPVSDKSVPVFLISSSSELKPLTYNVFLSRLKTCLRSMGIDSSKYSGHSFRRGGASFALECGVPVDLIQSQGDWRSNAYQSYIDPSLQFRQSVANTLGNYFKQHFD